MKQNKKAFSQENDDAIYIKFKDKERLVKVIKGARAVELVRPEELEEGKKITIISDSMFKTMFVNSKRIEYGAMLIALLLEVNFDSLLSKIKLLNNELDKESVSSKGERADYVAEIDDIITNIEVNCNATMETLLRNLDFSHRLYARKVKVGSNYDFTQCIQININNFKFEGIDDVISEFYLRDEKGNILTDKLRYINISIPNLMEKWYNEGIEKLTEAERYILSLVEPDIEKAKEIGMGDYFMLKGIEDQIEFGKNPEILEAYDKEWAYKSWGYQEGHTEGYENGRKEGYESGRTEGYESGHSEGRAEGHAKGLAEGLVEGENKERINIIKNIYNSGVTPENISKMTKIPLETIKAIIEMNP